MPDVEFVNLLGVLGIALVCAGLVSVLAFPVTATALGVRDPIA